MNIRRHTKTAIILHWVNAVCWLFLLASGFGMLANAEVQPVGAWFVHMWGEFDLLFWHKITGLGWITICAVLTLSALRSMACPFLREISDLHPKEDGLWCWRKALNLIPGKGLLERLGLESALPAQGFYNAGQKYVALIAVAASMLLALTGLVLFFAPDLPVILVQWSIFIHFASASLMAVFLPVHIYMAAFAPGEKPALMSMFSGFVPLEFIRHHNPRWFAQLEKKTGVSDVRPE